MKKISILILILLISSFVNAQEINTERFENIVKSLKLDKSAIKDEFLTEKKMPNEEDSYIIVVPVLIGKEEEDFFTVKNYILITDEKGNIKNQYIDPVEISSDAMRLSGFTIDTGLYNLSTNIRAFGLKVNIEGSSRPNPYSSQDISLYYTSGKTLKKVLNQFNLSTSSGEWDTNCAGEFEDQTSVIILDQAKTNNFSNLKIKTLTKNTTNKEVKGECVEDSKSATTYKTLKLNKGIYQ
jgi:hypothetical protein